MNLKRINKNLKRFVYFLKFLHWYYLFFYSKIKVHNFCILLFCAPSHLFKN